MPLIDDGRPWSRASWPVLKGSTLTGLILGFLAGALSHLSGNTISVNGMELSGWFGVWSLTAALGIGGFLFGLVWALVLRALGEAAKR